MCAIKMSRTHVHTRIEYAQPKHLSNTGREFDTWFHNKGAKHSGKWHADETTTRTTRKHEWSNEITQQLSDWND